LGCDAQLSGAKTGSQKCPLELPEDFFLGGGKLSRENDLEHCSKGISEGIFAANVCLDLMQDCKSVRTAVMSCVSLVNTHTHRQLRTGYTISSAN